MTIHEVRPPIIISDVEKRRLNKLANSALHNKPEVADELLMELERAEICPDPALPYNVVRMNSFVRFVTDKGTEHILQLVYPEDADIIRGRLSILSPIGTALIGLAPGQTMVWTDRKEQSRTLKIAEVSSSEIF
jgi:regulator of nucleoside diphosphate kinase